MSPGTWSCGYGPFVSLLAVPFHALGVALALVVWSILVAKRQEARAALALQLVRAFAWGWLGFTALTLIVARSISGLHGNPTLAIRSLEYLRLLAGITVTAIHVRGYRRGTGLGSLARLRERSSVPMLPLLFAGRSGDAQRNEGPHPRRVGLLAALVAGGLVSPPLIDAGPSWLSTYTTDIATDDCLACRVIGETRTPLLFHLLPRGSGSFSGGSGHHEGFVTFDPPDVAGKAREALAGRWKSASPGLSRVLERCLATGNARIQRRARPLLALLGRAGGGDDVLERWTHTARDPGSVRAAKGMLSCIRRNRRNRIGKPVDEQCDPMTNLDGGE